MSSTNLNQIIKQIDALSLDDQLHLIAHLAERARQQHQAAPPRRRWREIRSIASQPLLGEDAQACVSRTRREGDARRGQQWEDES